MKRRIFLQGLTALAAVPAIPAGAARITLPATSQQAIARHWASYMTSLHQRCTPEMLRPVLRTSAVQTQAIISRLLAEGSLTPAQAAPEATNALGKKLLKHLTRDSPGVNLEVPGLKHEHSDDSPLRDPENHRPAD